MKQDLAVDISRKLNALIGNVDQAVDNTNQLRDNLNRELAYYRDLSKENAELVRRNTLAESKILELEEVAAQTIEEEIPIFAAQITHHALVHGHEPFALLRALAGYLEQIHPTEKKEEGDGSPHQG